MLEDISKDSPDLLNLDSSQLLLNFAQVLELKAEIRSCLKIS